MDGINLRIEGGSYCCLLGPSGRGKTTVLRMIAGHEDPTDGEILIDGADVIGQTPRAHGTAMMFQSYALFPHLSVRDNVAFSMRVRGVRRAERNREASRADAAAKRRIVVSSRSASLPVRTAAASPSPRAYQPGWYQCPLSIWLRNSFRRSVRGLSNSSFGGPLSTISPRSMNTTRWATWRAKPIS